MGKTWFVVGTALVLVIILMSGLFLVIKEKVQQARPNPIDMVENKQSADQPSPVMERVVIKTDDGVELVGDLTLVPGARFAGILVHMMPETRSSFKELAQALQKAGWSTLAIDLRGHGESVQATKGKLDYRRFTDTEHQSSIFDLVAASRFLTEQGVPIENQFLVGASFGANLSLKFLSEHQEFRAAVLISPGTNYRGIMIEPLWTKTIIEKVLVLTADDDTYAAETVRLLQKKIAATSAQSYATGGHGTALIEKQPQATEQIIQWLQEKLL